ncbi:Transcriptional regulator, TetR family [[Actinomadura] parvosata subsp. kistnae]|uniref:TetR/AcrR family transcriptional regulator n=1 Tax=[Actinomadura] parvosata TaxID=1955412 RepID=UPI000D2907CF|nr:TetR family transcriptional regulator [Nonomuraea sp. ATCC 55076]SPL89717.1 Transcriptional regulator, TetR family [Actinomadura parvosata subsp. kistnae]
MSGPAGRDGERSVSGPAVRRRARRHDPGRRDRLIDAALAVIAERGVAGTTHREIARAADVPLGSMTYHFSSLEEVLAEAFTRHADAVARVFDERLSAARDRDEAAEAVVTLVSDSLLGSPADLVLSVELYVAAARNPALRAVTQAWMARSRRALERHFDPTTARELDALIEGLVLHSALSTDPMTPEQIRHAVLRYLR